jgi:hypothetical protein
VIANKSAITAIAVIKRDKLRELLTDVEDNGVGLWEMVTVCVSLHPLVEPPKAYGYISILLVALG